MATKTFQIRYLQTEGKELAISLLSDDAPSQAMVQLGIEPTPGERSQLATWLQAMATENDVSVDTIRDYVNAQTIYEPGLARFLFFVA